jgi:uncharacterized protein (DUF1778 family)
MPVAPKTRRIELRISDDERRLEEAAAAALGMSLSEFMRRAARGRAEEVLRERGRVVLEDEAARGFLAALDAEAPPPEAMRELFAREVPWAT